MGCLFCVCAYYPDSTVSLVPNPPTGFEVQGAVGSGEEAVTQLQHYHIRFVRYKDGSLWAYLLRLGFTGCCLTAAEAVTLSCAGLEIQQMKHHHFPPLISSHFPSFCYLLSKSGKLSHNSGAAPRQLKKQKSLAINGVCRLQLVLNDDRKELIHTNNQNGCVNDTQVLSVNSRQTTIY